MFPAIVQNDQSVNYSNISISTVVQGGPVAEELGCMNPDTNLLKLSKTIEYRGSCDCGS